MSDNQFLPNMDMPCFPMKHNIVLFHISSSPFIKGGAFCCAEIQSYDPDTYTTFSLNAIWPNFDRYLYKVENCNWNGTFLFGIEIWHNFEQLYNTIFSAMQGKNAVCISDYKLPYFTLDVPERNRADDLHSSITEGSI